MPADALVLTGSSPSALRHALIRARTALFGETSATAARIAREQERRLQLLDYRTASRSAAAEPRADYGAAVREFLVGEEALGARPLLIAVTGPLARPQLWWQAMETVGLHPVLANIVTPPELTVAELMRESAASAASAQVAWLEAHLPALGDPSPYDRVIGGGPWDLAGDFDALLAECGMKPRHAVTPVAWPIDGIPSVDPIQSGAAAENFEPPSLLKRLYAELTGKTSPNRAGAVKQAQVLLKAWRTLAPDGSRGSSGQAEPGSAPFFILGAPRSGTTLLRNLLRQHPGLIAPEETFFFRSGSSFGTGEYVNFHSRNATIQKHHALDGVETEDFQAILKSATSRRELSDRYMRRFAEIKRVPGRRWFDKTPQNVYGLPLLLASYPEARIVHIHRHPVEVAASAMAGRSLARHTRVGALNVWLEPVQIIEQCRPILGARLIEFSIDELKRSPENTMRWLTGMLDLPPHAYAFDHLDRDLGSPIVGEVMTEEDIDFIERRCAPHMRRFGYAPYTARARHS